MPPLITAIHEEALMRSLVTAVLEEEGYRVETYALKREAVACVRNAQPNLVLLDLWLETRWDGWEVFQALATDLLTVRIPVIMCTDIDPVHLPLGDLPTTPVAFLRTPFLLNDLLTAVERVLATS